MTVDPTCLLFAPKRVLVRVPYAVDPPSRERACPTVSGWSTPRLNDLDTVGQVCSASPGSMAGTDARSPRSGGLGRSPSRSSRLAPLVVQCRLCRVGARGGA